MQVIHFENILKSQPKVIATVVKCAADIYTEIAQENQGSFDRIKENAAKIDMEFSSHRNKVLIECNGVANLLRKIIKELTIAQRDKMFDLTVLGEIKSSIETLSRAMIYHKSRNNNVQDNIKRCQEEILNKQKSLKDERYNFASHAYYNIVAATTGGIIEGVNFATLTAGATITDIAIVSATAGAGILAGAAFVTGVLYLLNKYSKYSESNELKKLGERLAKIFGVVEKLEVLFDKSMLALEDYLDAYETIMRLAPDATSGRITTETEYRIADTEDLREMFVEIKNLALEKI